MMSKTEEKRVLEELRSLSDEELRSASLEKAKGKRKNYTERANLAQRVRCERSGVTMFRDENEPKNTGSYIYQWSFAVLNHDCGGCLYDDYSDSI